MPRPKHPNKDIEKAIKYAESFDWIVQKRQGHCWGRLLCGQGDSSGCSMSVWSTPKNPVHHANQIKRLIDKCTHNW
jgi:hypothetical protein